MKKVLLLIFLVMAFGFPVAAQVQEIRVGATLSLSGKLAFIGNAYLRGLELGVKKLNEDSGIKEKWRFVLLTEDNGGDASAGATGARKLIDVNNAQILFTSTTHVATAVAPIAAQNSRLMFYSSTTPALAEKYDTVFRDYFDAEDNGRTLAGEILRRGHKQIAILSEQSDACLLFVNAIKKSIEGRAAITGEEFYTPGETELKPLLLRQSVKKPEAFLFCTWRDTALVMRQMKELGLIAIPTFQWVAPFLPNSDTPEIRALLEENGAVSTWYALADGNRTPKAEEFEKTFLASYGEKPRPDSAYVFDDLLAVGQALKICGSVSGKCILDTLRATAVDGASGPLRFNEKRVSQRPVFLMQLSKGEWTAVKNP